MPRFGSGRVLLALGFALIAGSSCRVHNPGFSDERRQHPNEGATTVNSTSEALGPTRGEATATRPAQGSSTLREETATTGLKKVGANLSSASQTKSATGSEQGTSTSGCNQGERLCYLMKRDPGAKTYSDALGRTPALSLSEAKMSVEDLEDGGDLRFSSYVRIRETAIFVPVAKVDPPTNETYGFDVTVREVSCAPGGRCALAIVGNLGLAFVHASGGLSAECVYLNSNRGEVESVTLRVPAAGASVVGCLVEDKSLKVYVGAKTGEPEGISKLTPLSHFEIQVGGKSGFADVNRWTGDLGRIRVWSDLARMRSSLEGGG